MSTAPNIDLGSYFLQIKDSIGRLEEVVGSSSPINHPPTLTFKSDNHYRHNSSAISIEDDLNTF